MQSSHRPTPEIRPLVLGESKDEFAATAPEVQLAARNLATALRKSLSFLGRQRAQLVTSAPFRPGEEEPERDEDEGETEATDAAREPGPSVCLHMSADNGDWARLELDAPAILSILDGLFSSSAPSMDDEEDDEFEDDEEEEDVGLGEELTLAQRALMVYLLKTLHPTLAQSVEQSAHIALPLAEHRVLAAGKSYELPKDAVCVDIEVTEVPNPWRFRFSMGQKGVMRVLSQRELPTGGVQHTLAECLSPVAFNVVAELGRLQLKLSEVLELQPGAVLRLDSAVSDPIRVRVEGVTKFAATPVISRGQVAVKIEERRTE